MDLRGPAGGSVSTVTAWVCQFYTIKHTFIHFSEEEEEEDFIVDSKRTGGSQHNGRKQQRSLSVGSLPFLIMGGQAMSPQKKDIPSKGGSVEHYTEDTSPVTTQAATYQSGGSGSEDDLEDDRQDSDDSQPEQTGQEDVLKGVQRGLTTLMLQNIPTRFTQRSLLRKVNRAGFLRQYDFFYLPLDKRSRANRGFAFVNFLSPGRAKRFVKSFDGRTLEHSGVAKTVRVKLAKLQGIDMLTQRFRDQQEDGHGPIFFDLPAGRRGNVANSQDTAEAFPRVICSKCDFQPDGSYQFCPMCGTPVVGAFTQ